MKTKLLYIIILCFISVSSYAEPQVVYYFVSDNNEKETTQDDYEVSSDFYHYMNKLLPWLKKKGIKHVLKKEHTFSIKTKSKIVKFNKGILETNSGYIIVKETGEYKISRAFGTGYDVMMDVSRYLNIEPF